MNAFEFTHQEFFASTWESQLKAFIDSLDCSDNIIWHKKRKHKKINEELATLGYYVKRLYTDGDRTSFRLNKAEGKVDGWIYQQGKQIESVQIAIAYYDKEEAELDRRTMKGENFVESGWVGDKIELLKKRVKFRVSEKSKMNYQDIDTLLIGVRDGFVRQINTKYHDQKVQVVNYIECCLKGSEFKQGAIVDANFIGEGELLIVPNSSDRSKTAAQFSAD